MATMRCKICGQDMEFTAGEHVCTCSACGSRVTLPAVTEDSALGMYNYGNYLRSSGEYDESMFTFITIAKDSLPHEGDEGTADAEAFWCAAICRAGIQYRRDAVSGKWHPVCKRISETTILEDEDYAAALRWANDDSRPMYEAEASEIAELQKEFTAQSQVETQSDIDRIWKTEDMSGDLFYEINRENEIKQAEEAREQTEEALKEKKRNRRKTILFWSPFAAAALVMAFIALYFWYLKPLGIYRDGVEAMEAGNYAEAMTIFGGNAGFKDGNKLTAECVEALYGFTDATATTSADSPWYSITAEGALSFDATVYTGEWDIVVPYAVDGILVTSIADHGFYSADKITTLELPLSITEICDSGLRSLSSLTMLTIPGTVKSIGHEALRGCTSLVSLTLEEGIEYLGDGCISYCTNLLKIVVPDTVTEIRQGAFSFDTVLSECKLSSSLTFLGNFVFSHCYALTELYIPDGIPEIRDTCFAKCTSLETIRIPATVTSIESGAFAECAAIRTVQFGGTQEQWKAVDIAAENDYMQRAAFTYNAD